MKKFYCGKLRKNIFPALCLSFIGLFLSCIPEENEYPKNVLFYEHFKVSSSTSSILLTEEEKVLIINSAEDLEKHAFSGDFYYIDFSKYTLLMTGGYLYEYAEICSKKNLVQNSKQNYTMYVDIGVRPCLTADIRHWKVAIIIDKIADDAHVELNLTKKEL